MLCDMSWKNNVLISGDSYRQYNKEHGGHAKSTSRKVVGSIPDGVIGIFLRQFFRPHYGPGVS
jgi:hypothetical protein